MAKNYVTNYRGENYSPDRLGQIDIKDEPLTPDIDFDEYDYSLNFSSDKYCGSMKKSLSTSDINVLRDELLNFKDDSNKEEIYARYRRPTHHECSTNELSRHKFVSVAEAIYHFQRDTPGRFHSAPRQARFQSSQPLTLTKPQSPTLRCRARSRTLRVLSQKEKEEMELEEIKKYKFKVHPIPKSVIDGPQNLPEVPRKPCTKPEPFNLTEIIKKPNSASPVIKFKAKPAPKHILEQPQIPLKQNYNVKSKCSDKPPKENCKNLIQEKEKSKVTVLACRRDGKTFPKPFSFEKRDEQLKLKKEEKIKQRIEEERKIANQFKAKPIPCVIKKNMQIAAGKSSTSATSSENKENYHFEARPATVLYKQPFKLIHTIQHTNPSPFQLNSDKRAQEREQYDKYLKEKEEEKERLRKQKELELKEIEQKTIAEMRTQLVHHPKPALIKSPFVPQKSCDPVTVPETPKFIRRLKLNGKHF